MRRTIGYHVLVTALLLSGAMIVPASAGIVVYEKDDKKVEIGGRVQMQYREVDPDGGDSSDEIFFRRLRPYISGSVTENWMGKIQFDFGESEDDDEVKIKDAYMRYSGFDNIKLTIGNSKTPFSREFLASSKRQQLVERSFVGDHNFGAPDRQLGVRLDGHCASKKITYAANFGAQEHDPDIDKLDFDTPVNRDSDWNQGWVAAGRVDYHPLGYVPFDQADFGSDEWKFNVSLAAFTWDNDDDNNTFTDDSDAITPEGIAEGKADLDSADGVELSAGVRGRGFSADAEYHMISGDTVDSSFTGGLYEDGETDLDILAFEGGYLLPGNVELVAGWDSLDADNYDEAWERTSFGVNWYWNKHKAKIQASYRMSENFEGADDLDRDELFAQVQFVF